jgi:hypothetical protein
MAAIAAALASLALAGSASAATFIAGNDGGRLAYFQSENPKRFVKLDVTGLEGASETFSGLDVRPANRKLWALTWSFPDAEYRVYRVKVNLDERSAELTKLAGPFTITGVNDNNLGFAFNPVTDEMRIVEHDSDANWRLDATTFGLSQDTSLAYATDDPNFGNGPGIMAIGYTNQRVGAARTKLYGIDEFPDAVVRIKPPASGLLHTVGPLGVDTTFGFDLDIAPGGEAYALLSRNGPRLYRVNLRTGNASGLGQIGRPDASGRVGRRGAIHNFGRPFSFALVSRRLVR